VSKPGTTPNPPKLGESESSQPMPEPDPWLLGEIEALADASEKSGAKPASESSGASRPLDAKAAASEASGAKKPPSESSGSRKPVIGAEPGVMPAKPTRSATAALVGIGDDLIANASAEDKPLFSAIVANAEAKSASSEPDVFDELGLSKTPAVITGQTLTDVATKEAEAKAGDPPKKTEEGFPVPPPRAAAPKKTLPSTATASSAQPAKSPSTSRAGKPMSRWTPHVLLGTLGLASIVAIAFRCSGTSTNTAQADTGKHAPVVAKVGDEVRGGEAASAGGSANAGGGNDAVDGEEAREGAAGGGAAAEDEQAQAEGEGERAAGEGGGNGEAADDSASAGAADGGDDAAGDAAPSEDAAKDDTQAAAAPTKDSTASTKSGTAKDTTPASTSSKSGSSKSRTSPTPIAPSAPSADANLTAEELLELARKAWAAGNYRDAYKYANKSRYKKASTEATELATLSACKLNLEKSARASFDSLSGDKRRKVRQKCRDYGVWVGL
jgi:hypothetical protein